MKVRDMRQLIHDKDDDEDIEFAAGGECVVIDAHLYVPEWDTIYLGVEPEDIKESLIEWELANQGESEDEDDTPWVEDREAFMKALQEDEDLASCGDMCTLPPPKESVEEATPSDTEMM